MKSVNPVFSSLGVTIFEVSHASPRHMARSISAGLSGPGRTGGAARLSRRPELPPSGLVVGPGTASEPAVGAEADRRSCRTGQKNDRHQAHDDNGQRGRRALGESLA